MLYQPNNQYCQGTFGGLFSLYAGEILTSYLLKIFFSVACSKFLNDDGYGQLLWGNGFNDVDLDRFGAGGNHCFNFMDSEDW